MSILAFAAIASIGLVRESAGALARTRGAEAEIARASALLSGVALWSAADLDRHLGRRTQGSWRMYVERDFVVPTYHVTLQDSSGRRVLLQTTLYRLSRADSSNPAP